jgi:hypothetical protein
MTTAFKSTQPLMFAEVFDGKLAKLGIYERITGKTTGEYRSLTDGRNSIWIEGKRTNEVSKIVVWGTNNPTQIFLAISETFKVDIVLEEVAEPEAKKELNSTDNELLEEISRRARAKVSTLEADFYIPNNEHEIFAQVQLINVWIGLNLVQEDSTLLRPERTTEFLTKIRHVSELMSNAILHARQVDSYIDHLEDEKRDWNVREEDKEEGPIDCAFVFECRNNGIIVAVERPDVAERQRALRDDVPF